MFSKTHNFNVWLRICSWFTQPCVVMHGLLVFNLSYLCILLWVGVRLECLVWECVPFVEIVFNEYLNNLMASYSIMALKCGNKLISEFKVISKYYVARKWQENHCFFLMKIRATRISYLLYFRYVISWPCQNGKENYAALLKIRCLITCGRNAT